MDEYSFPEDDDFKFSKDTKFDDVPIWSILPSYELYARFMNSDAEPPGYGTGTEASGTEGTTGPNPASAGGANTSTSAGGSGASTPATAGTDGPVTPLTPLASTPLTADEMSRASAMSSARSSTSGASAMTRTNTGLSTSTSVSTSTGGAGASASEASATNVSASTSASGTSTRTSISGPSTSSAGTRTVINDQHPLWGDTILDHLPQLNNLTHTQNPYAQALEIDIKFTKEVCEVDKVPELIDPSHYEYKQGDFINGYITIVNTKPIDVVFKMFYVLFEGIVTNGEKSTRFLEMFDFSGSYHEGNISRLVTEYKNPYTCPDLVDWDGYRTCWLNKTIRGNTKSKRFFSFKIPESLLDTLCGEQKDSHVRILPTLGTPGKGFLGSQGFFNTKGSTGSNENGSTGTQGSPVSPVKDFSFPNSSITYQITSTLIGKGSLYGFNANKQSRVFNKLGDEYLILKNMAKPIRIVGMSNEVSCSEKAYRQEFYTHFMEVIEEKLRLGRELQRVLTKTGLNSLKNGSTTGQGSESEKLEALIETFHEQVKTQGSNKQNQLYTTSKQEKCEFSDILTVETAKVGILGKKNDIKVTTPNTVYTIPYVPLKIHRKTDYQMPSLKLSIPITMRLNQVPKLKGFHVELAVSTIKSDSPIPLEFNHDMFLNQTHSGLLFKDPDDFSHNVVDKFRDIFYQFKDISGDLDLQNLLIEKELFEGIKTLATIKEKLINLVVYELEIHQNGRVQAPKWRNTAEGYETQFEIHLDLAKVSTKGVRVKAFDEFTLVPDFQSCYMGRFYYLRVYFDFGSRVLVKVPVSIQR